MPYAPWPPLSCAVRLLSLVWLCTLSLAPQSWAASSTLSAAQLVTLGTAIRAEPSLADELASDLKADIAAFYNALNSTAPTSAAFYIWKTTLTPAEYTGNAGIVPADAALRTTGQAWTWDTKTGQSTRTLDPSVTGFASWVTAVWPGTTTATNLLTLAQREATRAEKLFATGTGTQESPAVAAWVGTITVKDVTKALQATP